MNDRFLRLSLGVTYYLCHKITVLLFFLGRFLTLFGAFVLACFSAILNGKAHPFINHPPYYGDILYVQTQFGSVSGIVFDVRENYAVVGFPRLPDSVGCPVFSADNSFMGTYSLGHYSWPTEERKYIILFRGRLTRVYGVCYEATINFTVKHLSEQSEYVMLYEAHDPKFDIVAIDNAFESSYALQKYFRCKLQGDNCGPLAAEPPDVH
jgi:hypothetical protein